MPAIALQSLVLTTDMEIIAWLSIIRQAIDTLDRDMWIQLGRA